MKKLILLVFIIAFGVYWYVHQKHNSKHVTEVIKLDSTSTIKVAGVVKSNFNILGKGYYELQDKNEENTSIIVICLGKLPTVNTEITREVKKNNIITWNDATYALYEEIE